MKTFICDILTKVELENSVDIENSASTSDPSDQTGSSRMMYFGVPFEYVWIQGCVVDITLDESSTNESIIATVDDGTGDQKRHVYVITSIQ